jgi:fatty acid desaturase
MNEPTSARIGDAERERALYILSHHVGTGRLSLSEFEARSTIAAAAGTSAELARMLADLPIPLTPAPTPAARPARRTGVIAAAIIVLAVAAALTTGHWWWLALIAAIPAFAAYRRNR